jgi:hypothetical protein
MMGNAPGKVTKLPDSSEYLATFHQGPISKWGYIVVRVRYDVDGCVA